MFLQEPQRSQYDLSFSILGVPIRIHPFFWLLVGLLGMSGLHPSYGMMNLVILITWVMVVTFSVLVHELGHALTGRMYGSRGVRITLYSFGGMAHNATGRNRIERIMVIAAGPLSTMLVGIPFIIFYLRMLHPQSQSMFAPAAALVQQYLGPMYVENFFLKNLIWDMFQVNLFWALINLVPIYPLDGGQICGEVLTANRPIDGMKVTYWISVVAAALIAVFFLAQGAMFIGLFFGYLGYTNFQQIQQSGRGPGRWY